MPETANVPTARAPDLVTFTVLVEGEALPGTIQLLEASVLHAANKVSSARLAFRDGDVADRTFALSESGRFDPGAAIEFKVGYHREEQTVFTGIIVTQRIRAFPGQPARLVVECRHRATLMTLARRTRQFAEQTDSDTAAAILGEYSLVGDIAATTAVQPQLVQWDATDWDFLLLRARAHGLLVVPTLTGVDLRQPDVAATPVLGLGYGGALEAFEGEIDARLQPAAARALAWDPAQQAPRQAEATASAEPPGGSLGGAALAGAVSDPETVHWHAGSVADDELAAWAQGSLLRARLAKLRATARCRGTAAITAGTIVELEGLGARFNGPAFVGAVRHQVSQGDWRTEVQFGLEPAWFSFDGAGAVASSRGLLPRIGGLHIGVVRQLAGDPAGGERILVDLPVTLPGGPGLWARLATLEAGSGRGHVFRPEIGDEVVVGFFEEDPRHPVVLGSLHSGAHPAPIAADDANPQKGYTSRSDLRLLFDEEKKSITLSTPAGNKLILSDEARGITLEDENGHKLVTSPEGITFRSAGRFEQTAASSFTLEGATELGVRAGASLSLEGSASAALKSSGSTEVKGGLVRIN